MVPPLSQRLLGRGLILAARQAGDEDGLGGIEGPLAEAGRMVSYQVKRQNRPDPSHGVLDPHDINNVGFFVLFALIGVGFILVGIWFFFWARNGGFHFKQGDWEDYKSTVLRRRGPNGTLLSGATPSTDLGGGSIYKDVAEEEDGRTVMTETTALTGITAGASDLAGRQQRKEKRERRQREKAMKKQQQQQQKQQQQSEKRDGGRRVGQEGVTDEMAEKTAREELRSYRYEKPARVGGLNKQSEGSNWDGSTNTSGGSTAASSDMPSHRQSTPGSGPRKKETGAGGGIRKVQTTSAGHGSGAGEAERIRAEARRLREESRGQRRRRDFSYQRPGGAASSASESLLEGGSGQGSELGTKSYHHPMPELRTREREREQRRTRRGEYKRGKGDGEF